MFKQVMSWLQQDETTRPSIPPELAAATLLVEVVTADDHWDERELASMQAALQNQLQLEPAALEALMEEAKAHQAHTNDLYELTRCLNEAFDDEQKYQLVENLWRVAWADGDLDRYEDHTIRKIAELLYVRHSDFIKAKLATQPSSASD